jgi:glycosyltransferase involved in cell wall biosynthesis
MSETNQPSKIAFVGDYLPRKCGIATFTRDLHHAVAAQYPAIECGVLAINDLPEGYDYEPEVRFEIQEQRLLDYQEAANFLRFNGFDVLSLQHEFGIYGGNSGGHILAFLREVNLPVVTTLHTFLQDPDPNQRQVMEEIVRQSERLVVMTERGHAILRETYDAPTEKIDLIAHGIPDMRLVDPNSLKDQFGLEGKKLLLTFGLLSPGKGIEYVIQALPEIARQHPDLIYMVLGATHPNLVRAEGERYRLSLERLAEKLGVSTHIAFYNRFVELEELKQFIGAADIYITPYLAKAQATSGTLCYAFGSGKAVISTPYWHAEELLAEERGVLVPFRDSEAIATAVTGLLEDTTRLNAMSERAYSLGRKMIWSQTAKHYFESFRKARADHRHHHGPRYVVRTLAQQPIELPELMLDHVERLTDSTGIFQHAVYAMPDYAEGYCVDDNARALLLMVLLESSDHDTPARRRLATTYAAFIQYALGRNHRHFRNFMSFDRQWRDESGSDDCFGRCLWVLGTCLGRSKHRSFQTWAAGLFLQAVPRLEAIKSPRALAFGLIGVQEYLNHLGGDRNVSAVSDKLTKQLIRLYERQSEEDWPWFEPVLSYDNAKLPHALIFSGRHGGAHGERALELGLQTLRWLVAEQTREGCFVPIGSNGFYRRGGARARFDQQPIEAQATVSACIAAFEATRDPFWRDEAQRAFEWFLGRNDLDQPLYNPASGGCFDGLHFDRVNLNQGAESTLAFLLALVPAGTGRNDNPANIDRCPHSGARGRSGCLRVALVMSTRASNTLLVGENKQYGSSYQHPNSVPARR